MIVSPAPALKKELTKTFPETKFSVTTKTSSVSVNCITVKWYVPVYSNATEKAVREIAKKYESIERRENSIDNTTSATGYSISFAPKYDTERKDWALQATEIHNITNAVWDAKYDVFKQADNKINWQATDQYHEYLRNSIFCDLVDENGNQPSAKICYYKDINTQSEILELEPKMVEPNLVELVKETITSVGIQSNAPECKETFTAPITFASPKTNLIPFPSPQQPEPEPAAQSQIDDCDSFYLQSYQAWVNKLIARGEYGRIKSFEEWYLIAVEVM